MVPFLLPSHAIFGLLSGFILHLVIGTRYACMHACRELIKVLCWLDVWLICALWHPGINRCSRGSQELGALYMEKSDLSFAPCRRDLLSRTWEPRSMFIKTV